ncbi:MAG: M28 family peptidase [Planctomycetota bacterium]|jgi:hypothetical protein
MRRFGPACLLTAVFLCPAGGDVEAGPRDEPSPDITRRDLQRIVRILADDDLAGREAGTAECDQAADLVAAEFERLGLRPVGDDGTWFQHFTSPRGMRVLPTTTLVATDDRGRTTVLEVGEEFAPLDVSGRGDVTAGAVFAGYGISAPDLGYDDYAGIDVRGKVVVVLRHAPAYEKASSPFGNTRALQRYAAFQAKAEAAAGAGAAALVIVNDPASSTKRSDDQLRPPGGSATGKIPVVHVTWRAGKNLGKRIGVPFVRRQQQIDGRLEPRSEALEGVTIRVHCDLEPEQRHMRNIAAMLLPEPAVTGEGPAPADLSGEVVALGAHYDHVGLGRFGSLANANGKIHNGADDNASGTSALMEIAGYLAERRREIRRRILFLAFSGEELGLLGSKHYVSAPLVPLADTIAMLNFDMVGRLEKNRLFIGGTGTSPIWPALLEELNGRGRRFDLTLWPGGKAPSDHTSFYERNLPVLFFFTGLHSDYHRPSDDWNTIEYAGQARVAQLGALVAFDLATRDERPQFTRCDAGGFSVGPYSGIAVEQRADGVYVAHVDDRSPAQRVGFKVGDRIVEWNGQPVPNTNVYNDLISRAEPGEKVDIVISRGGRTRKIRLKLGST